MQPYPIAIEDGWQFKGSQKVTEWTPARVPGCVHTDMVRNDLIPEPYFGTNELELDWTSETAWTYRTSFSLNHENLKAEHLDLVCEGLDTLADVYINEEHVARTENMHVGWRFPVKELLHDGENTIEVRFSPVMDYIRERNKIHYLKESNDPVGGVSNIRKMQCNFGWDWGPRFVTSGIWLPLYIECWNTSRIENLRIRQRHEGEKVELGFETEVAGEQSGISTRYTVSLDGAKVAEGEGDRVALDNPRLWWPNDMGEQPLYDVEVQLIREGKVLDTMKKRVGLRTVELITEPDEWGESFHFRVNGKDTFTRGANWIPAHCFVTEVGEDTYRDLLTSAKDTHMNMIRVWGGGIYEKEAFYDICDELGLLVWQDFMFACAQYPVDEPFLKLVEQEVIYQIRRLRDRTCLALWCGNNEGEWFLHHDSEEQARKYSKMFHEFLPALVNQHDGEIRYWSSSPHKPEDPHKQEGDLRDTGDTHDWGVWHGMKPASHFEQTYHRFCSEFGMQAYPHPEVVAPYLSEGEMNVFSREMENHQKHSSANFRIFHYIAQNYRFPRDHMSLVYLSQMNQAVCVKGGVEHWRRNRPRCMGAIYWQLNDCWPVASWSSIDFGGRWKALQYESKRMYAPLLASVRLEGAVEQTKGNYWHNRIKAAHLHAVSDAMEDFKGTLDWELFHFQQGIVEKGSDEVALSFGDAREVTSVNLEAMREKYEAEQSVLRVTLRDPEGNRISRQSIFPTLPRFLKMPQVEVELDFLDGGDSYIIALRAPNYVHGVFLDLPGIRHRLSDNFFDIYPDEAEVVYLAVEDDVTLNQVAEGLTILTMADTAM